MTDSPDRPVSLSWDPALVGGRQFRKRLQGQPGREGRQQERVQCDGKYWVSHFDRKVQNLILPSFIELGKFTWIFFSQTLLLQMMKWEMSCSLSSSSLSLLKKEYQRYLTYYWALAWNSDIWSWPNINILGEFWTKSFMHSWVSSMKNPRSFPLKEKRKDLKTMYWKSHQTL